MMALNQPDGVLVVDKPAGCSSHDIVLKVRRLFPKIKVGHLGTLDPFATGVLPLCLGKATRLSQFLSQGEKVYQALVTFGAATDTGDFTGKVIFESTPPPLDAGFLGPQLTRIQTTWMQKPPSFSARKVDGVPLYIYARKGIPKEGRAREVTVSNIRLLEVGNRQCLLQLHCSPGTYVRAIADELGKSIGCGAHLQELRRLATGEFDLSQALDGKRLLSNPSPDEILPHILSIHSLLPNLPGVVLIEEGLKKLKNGMDIDQTDLDDRESLKAHLHAEIPAVFRLLDTSGQLVAIGYRVPSSTSSETSNLSEKAILRIHPKVVLL